MSNHLARNEAEHNNAIRDLVRILTEARLTKQQRLDAVDVLVSLDANCILTDEDYDKVERREPNG